VSQRTLLSLYPSTERAHWEVDGAQVSNVTSSEVEVAFANIGTHVVVVRFQNGDAKSFEVTARVVRRELRELTESERDAYFGAVFTLYALSDAEGQAKFGPKFYSANWLVREHLFGAADRSCDHWHDDAGFANHHIGITWQFENALRAVDPTVAAHYWDYTLDERKLGEEWYLSKIFDENWFGNIDSLSNDDHIVDQGRFAFTPVMNARNAGYMNITNPYGLLRSPWNVNKVPFVMRSSYVMGDRYDSFTSLPSCTQFQEYVVPEASYADIVMALNGELHGPVHLMVGGLWGDDGDEWRRVAESEGDPDQFLLLSKFLWRQGFVRCPDVCSDDTPVSDCRCDCPDAIVERAGSAYELLDEAGVLELWSDDNVNDVFTDQPLTSPYNVTYDDLLDKLCAVGLPGEMFTSAAPQDPIFWPLHGNAERFLQYVRLLNETGNITLDATWGYEHQTHEGSDTHVVCDWSSVDATDVTSMPVCRRDTCPGHKADDLLPYASLTDTQVGLYTNEEFYELTAPNSRDLTYVYNSLSYWPGCSNNHTFTVEYPSPTFAPTVNPKNERRT
jgi:hypothetical protein